MHANHAKCSACIRESWCRGFTFGFSFLCFHFNNRKGVYTAAIAHAEIGIAIKIDDGFVLKLKFVTLLIDYHHQNSAVRAAEFVLANILVSLENVWTDDELTKLREFTVVKLYNWRQLQVGEMKFVGVQ